MKKKLILKLTQEEALFLSTILLWCGDGNETFTEEMETLQEETEMPLRATFNSLIKKVSDEIHNEDWCPDPDCKRVPKASYKGGKNFKLL